MNSWDDLSATVKDLLEQKKYEQVVTLSQNFELQLDDDEAFQTEVCQFYAIFLASLIAVSNLNEAKYLWARIPSTYKVDLSNPSLTPASSEASDACAALANTWTVATALWRNDFPKVLTFLPETVWPSYLQSTMRDVYHNLTTMLLSTISKVYKNVSVDLLSRLLGLSIDQLQPALLHLKWSVQSDGSIILPPADDAGNLSGDVARMEEMMETMAKLVDYVSHMESKPLRVDVSGKAKK